jgi:XTP/dITP diphosphohydrolase
MTRLARGDRLVLATHNRGKHREFASLLAPHGIELLLAADLGLSEPDETAPDFAGNARLKAHAAATATGLPALADDSGFAVAALGGAPGVLSARWAGPGRDFALAMRRVHDEAAPHPDRAASFHCVLALAHPDGRDTVFDGSVHGSWCWPPRGANGFGYDAMFVPTGEHRSYAEMAPAEKEARSHRARAFALFAAACLPVPAA